MMIQFRSALKHQCNISFQAVVAKKEQFSSAKRAVVLECRFIRNNLGQALFSKCKQFVQNARVVVNTSIRSTDVNTVKVAG